MGCTKGVNIPSKWELDAEEKALLEKFFRYTFLYETGIYTLLGNKPLTEFYIPHPFRQDRVWWKRQAEKGQVPFPLLIHSKDKDGLDFYKKLPRRLRKKTLLVSDKEYIFDQSEILEKRWDLFEKIPLLPKYILLKKELFLSVDGNIPSKFFRITFANVLEVALTLEKYYPIFREFVGFDFDPLTISLELKEEKSLFWEILRGENRQREGIERAKASALWGLLFGFGERNSFYFSWKNRGQYVKNSACAIKALEKIPSFFPQPFLCVPSIKNFPIPYFASFSKEDPVVKRYKEERTKIQQLYKGKDFLDYTLDKMVGE